MIAEGLEFLKNLILAGATPQVIHESPRNKVVSIGGAIKDLAKTIPVRDHKASSLDDLISYVNDYHTADPEAHLVVWYSETAVIGILDDEDRLDKVTFPLVYADGFAAILSLAKQPRTFSHSEFIRLLRIQLSSVLAPGSLLELIRRIKFENGVSMTSDRARDRESLSREVLNSIESANKIPEAVTAESPVYQSVGERDDRYPIKLLVETLPDTREFQLIPAPDEVSRVLQKAMADIRDRLAERLDLEDQRIRFYYGSP